MTQVIATARGFFDGVQRNVGDRFEVPDGLESGWFKPVEAEDAEPTPAPRRGRPKSVDTTQSADNFPTV